MSIRLALVIIAASPLIALAVDYAWCRFLLWASTPDPRATAVLAEVAAERRPVSQEALDWWHKERELEQFDAIVAGETW